MDPGTSKHWSYHTALLVFCLNFRLSTFTCGSYTYGSYGLCAFLLCSDIYFRFSPQAVCWRLEGLHFCEVHHSVVQ